MVKTIAAISFFFVFLLSACDSGEPFSEVYKLAEVDQPPELIGGIDALDAERKYPCIAWKAGVEGYVRVKFVVEKNGKASGTTVEKGIGAGCDEESLRVIRSMQFIPARRKGWPVRVETTQEVPFFKADYTRPVCVLVN